MAGVIFEAGSGRPGRPPPPRLPSPLILRRREEGGKEGPELAQTEEPRLVSELEQMEAQYEPLLPVEKQLISWSVGLGILALGLLVWISYTFFPGAH